MQDIYNAINKTIDFPVFLIFYCSGWVLYAVYHLIVWSIMQNKVTKHNNYIEVIKRFESLEKDIKALSVIIQDLQNTIQDATPEHTPSSSRSVSPEQPNCGICDPEFLKYQKDHLDQFKIEHPTMSSVNVKKTLYKQWKNANDSD